MILRESTKTKDELELEAVKNGHSVKMDVDLIKIPARAPIDASSLWAESESTARLEERSRAILHKRFRIASRECGALKLDQAYSCSCSMF
jgi:hypothetical protein